MWFLIHMPLLFPSFIPRDSTDGDLTDVKHFCQSSLGYLTQGIDCANILNHIPAKFCRRLLFSARNFSRRSPRPMIVPALEITGINPGWMFVAPLEFFRVKTRAVFVASGRALGMFSESVLIPSRTPSLFQHILHVFGVSPKPEVIGIYARRIVAAGTVVADHKPICYRSFVDSIRQSMSKVSRLSCIEKPISVFVFPGRPNPAPGLRINGKFLAPFFLLPLGENNLATISRCVRRSVSGFHIKSMRIVRAFGSLDTAPTLALLWPSSVANKA